MGRGTGSVFDGDFILFVGLLALGRFFTIIAALDTGSAFEGMGASREAWFSALTEPALFLAVAALAHVTGSLTLSRMLVGLGAGNLGGPAVFSRPLPPSSSFSPRTLASRWTIRQRTWSSP